MAWKTQEERAWNWDRCLLMFTCQWRWDNEGKLKPNHQLGLCCDFQEVNRQRAHKHPSCRPADTAANPTTHCEIIEILPTDSLREILLLRLLTIACVYTDLTMLHFGVANRNTHPALISVKFIKKRHHAGFLLGIKQVVFTWGKHKNKARKVKVFKVQVSAVTSLNMRSSLKSVFFLLCWWPQAIYQLDRRQEPWRFKAGTVYQYNSWTVTQYTLLKVCQAWAKIRKNWKKAKQIGLHTICIPYLRPA